MTRFQTSKLVIMLLAMVLLAVACGQSDSSVTGAARGGADGELAFGLQRCDPDLGFLTADPSFYRDEPIYVGNEQPVELVRDWAQRQPGYQDIWLDRDNNGWIAVAFSEDVAARQSELEAEFPGVGVVAVEVTTTEAELRALRTDVEAALQGLSSWGSSHSTPRGAVEVSVPVLDEETLARLAPFAGPTLCVSGLDPVDAVVDGPQPTEGDGWRLLGTDRTGPSYRTGVATTPEQYQQLWAEAGLSGDLPRVDFESEIVIWFGAVYGSGCPIRMDDVTFDSEQQLVHPEFVLPGNPTGCNDDDNPEAYVVAVSRDRLPEAPFAVQLDADDPPAGAPEERTTVEVDLRSPGSAAATDDLDVNFAGEGPPPLADKFTPGYVIEDGFPWTLLLDLDCSVDIIGPLNGVSWRANDPALINGPPQAWESAADGRLAEAEFLLTSGPPVLTITVGGETVGYEPIPASEDGDMSCR